MTAAEPNKSTGRYPDGADNDSNCADFHTQAAATLAVASAAGTSNIKVSSVEGFHNGQKLLIDSGANQETAVIANVGTAGATTIASAVASGGRLIPVANAFGFRPGQTITVDDGPNTETAVIAGGRRGASTVAVAEPLKFAHAAGIQIAGTGITLTSALEHTHASGTQVADQIPTPGAPNQY